MTVSLLDYGLGNLGSVSNMFRVLGVETKRVSTPEDVLKSDRVLLPGIGAFDTGMSRLADAGLQEPLKEFALAGRPLLGICLGMQLLLDSSDEGEEKGLGLIPGQSHKFESSLGARVPHMGWNSISPQHPDSLIAGVEVGSRFYFVHSYHVVPQLTEHVLTTTPYGSTNFVSMVRSGNIMGAQFHPEKSHAFGMTVLRNFSTL